ncbi:MAG TPA: hypothetical protein PLB92_05905 [Rhodoglobus sp.]|nr:hypothetical protein [Rhodoglobus sp.]
MSDNRHQPDTARRYAEMTHRAREAKRRRSIEVTEEDMSWLIRNGPEIVVASFGASGVWLDPEDQVANIAALQLHWAEAFLA